MPLSSYKHSTETEKCGPRHRTTTPPVPTRLPSTAEPSWSGLLHLMGQRRFHATRGRGLDLTWIRGRLFPAGRPVACGRAR